MTRRRVTSQRIAERHAISATDQTDMLEVKYINPSKGRGVFALSPFQKGDFVVEYRGEMIDFKESERRRRTYDTKGSVFMFDFLWHGRKWCIDAASEDGSLGRLVNDDHVHPNCKMKRISADGNPHLCLFADKDIDRGEEITYDYGDSNCPWREKGGEDCPVMSTENVTLPCSSSPVMQDKEEAAPSIMQMKEKIPDGSDELFDSSADSGEEYVPASSGESTDGTDGTMTCEIPATPLSDWTVSQSSSRSRPTPCQSTRSATHVTTPDSTGSASRGCGESLSVSIPAVSKKEDGSRMYNKKQFCLFCGSAFTKVSKHLEHTHSKELEVAKAFHFPKGSKQRRLQLESLRNKGNFAHNAEVLKTGKGKLVARKQPRENSQGQDYIHCLYCQGLFIKRALWRHVKICKFKPVKPQPGKTRIQALCAFASPIPSGVSEDLWRLVNHMNQDDIAHEVKSDWCIMEFGKHLYNKHGSDVNKHEYIRQKLRELGRLRLHGKEVTPLKTIKEYIIPANFMHVVSSVKDTAQAKNGNAKSLPLKLGYSLKKISMLLESDSMIKGDKDTAEEARCFRTIYDAKWHELVSAASLKSLTESKWNAPLLLPFTEDVKKLHTYLDEKQQQYQHELESDTSSQNWAKVAKVTLAQVIPFNRRREGEVSKMSLSAFSSTGASTTHEDVDLALSELEKRLCHHFTRIEIRGKRGRKVAVLLNPAMQKALDMLHQKRAECGILKENTYVFARPGAMSHYRGSDCIRQFVQLCDVKNPVSLTSTRLRKHVATLSKVLNLHETELDQLADFLGHDIRVHREFYRLPEGTLQLAKISKILMAMEQGRLAEFKGKSLDEIYINPRETIPLDKYSDIEESEEDLAEVMSEWDQERDAEVVPDMSPLQKRKRSGLLQEYEGETHSEADDIPVQKAQSKRIVPDMSPLQKRKRSGLLQEYEGETHSEADDIPVQKAQSKRIVPDMSPLQKRKRSGLLQEYEGETHSEADDIPVQKAQSKRIVPDMSPLQKRKRSGLLQEYEGETHSEADDIPVQKAQSKRIVPDMSPLQKRKRSGLLQEYEGETHSEADDIPVQKAQSKRIVPDMSPLQKRKRSGLLQEYEGETHSEADDIPVQKAQSKRIVPDMSPLQKRKRSGLLQENEGETHSEADDIPVQKAQSKRTRTLLKRRPWDTEEITAVEKHLMSFIRTCRVPGKGDCVKCLTSEPKALRNRTWTAVKFYIKNRITALKRKI